MDSGPITSWQIEGEKVEVVADFLFLGSKITADSDCSHEIKRCLLLGRKAMTDLDSVFFADKGLYSQSYGFSSSHVRCEKLDYKEGWALKNWCFWTVVLRRLLRVPWTARRSNQSILKEINPSIHWKYCCWSWSSSTLATWCKEPTHCKRPWCWERLRARGEGGSRGWDGWMASSTQWTWVWASSGR